MRWWGVPNVDARYINRFIDTLEPAAARAFRRSVNKIKSDARLADLADAIQAQDLDAVFRHAGLSKGAWSEVTEQVRRAYAEGASLVAQSAPSAVNFTFDINNPRSQQWLATHSSEFVTRIDADQKQAIRNVLSAGFQQGRNPRNIALDIVGRVDSATGRRQGGVIGLTDQMAGYVGNMQRTLENDPRAYFIKDRETGELKHRYKRADKRFDAKIKRAIASGKPLTASEINQITGRYSDRLLKLRGDNIARTEVLGSLNEGMDEALRQAVDEDLIQPENIKRVWDATGDNRTRPDHMSAEGQAVGLDEPFTVGGVKMMHPGDFGAPASQVINCRCVVRQEVDWLGEGDAGAGESQTEASPQEQDALTDSEKRQIDEYWSVQNQATLDKFEMSRPYASQYGLSEYEHKSVMAYTGDAYTEINEKLSGRLRGAASAWVPAMTKSLTGALTKLPAKPGTHFRGMMVDGSAKSFLANYKVGKTITNRPFLSTTTRINIVDDFVAAGQDAFVFVVKGKSGRDVKKLSIHSHEDEILYMSGSSFKVTSVTRMAGGAYKIGLEEI